jgi:hypothetical protein
MNGWLGLIHQGLPPWKKRQASLGAPTVSTSCYLPHTKFFDALYNGYINSDWKEIIL